MAKKRRRFKQTTTFRSRIEAFALDLRSEAEQTQSAEVKEKILRRARKADVAVDLDDWISGRKESVGLLEVIVENLEPGVKL